MAVQVACLYLAKQWSTSLLPKARQAASRPANQPTRQTLVGLQGTSSGFWRSLRFAFCLHRSLSRPHGQVQGFHPPALRRHDQPAQPREGPGAQSGMLLASKGCIAFDALAGIETHEFARLETSGRSQDNLGVELLRTASRSLECVLLKRLRFMTFADFCAANMKPICLLMPERVDTGNLCQSLPSGAVGVGDVMCSFDLTQLDKLVNQLCREVPQMSPRSLKAHHTGGVTGPRLSEVTGQP